MFTRSLCLPAASLAATVAALVAAAPAQARMSLADYAIQRCEDEVVARLDRSVRFHDVAFEREPEVDRLTRSDVDVRGGGFYEPVYGRAPRVGFTYSCRFDDRRDRAMAQVFPGFALDRPERPGRGRWHARVDAPMPPIERPAPLPREEDAVPAPPPPPEPLTPSAGDSAAAAAAAAESVGDESLGGDIVTAIDDSKGTRPQDDEIDQGLEPYQVGEDATCYPAQRACYGQDGYDAGLSNQEFGPQDEAPPSDEGEGVAQEEGWQ